jgi:phosphoenolpyruvate---glycerone phosphotransferase subunit DhaL
MMSTSSSAPDIKGTRSIIDVVESWLRLAATRIHEQAPTLTALDQAIGDGDHGINMDRGFTAVVATLDAGRPDADTDRAAAAALLRNVGRTLISTVGGASGPLYGTAFMRAGGAVASADVSATTAELIIAALDAAIAGIEGLGKAGAGNKTMLDALQPAARAGRDAAGNGSDAAATAGAIAAAAEAGAAATIPMLATKGRASYLGERSIGHQDPGATSASLLLRALADATS